MAKQELITVRTVTTDWTQSKIAYYLQVADNVKGKGFYTSREFASEAEAQIAKGILMLLLETKGINNECYSEYDFLLRATLRLCYSTKTWSE